MSDDTETGAGSNPWTRDEIVAELRRVHDESRAYWQTFAPDAFLRPLGAAWSPADNVRHLTKSMRAVTMGLRIPRLLLWLRFGRPHAESRKYGELRRTYIRRLAEGGQAGRFAPAPLEAVVDPAAERTRILSRHAEAVDALIDAIARWPDAALDRRRLPHPLLGMLTVREMLFFTVYHNQHHVAVARRRAAEAGVA